MIQIGIDDRACVGCELCADVCPTKVFQVRREPTKVEVSKPAECFGCMSCSEMCPASAITHTGAQPALALHVSPYGLDVARKLGLDPARVAGREANADEMKLALRDLGLRMVSVAAVFKQTIGAGLPAVGTLAGRTLATHLPRYERPRNVEEALEMVRKQIAPAWDTDIRESGGKLAVTVRSCFVREVCAGENAPLGGEMCTLFTQFLLGFLHARLKPLTGYTRLKLSKAQTGPEQCQYEIQTFS